MSIKKYIRFIHDGFKVPLSILSTDEIQELSISQVISVFLYQRVKDLNEEIARLEAITNKKERKLAKEKIEEKKEEISAIESLPIVDDLRLTMQNYKDERISIDGQKKILDLEYRIVESTYGTVDLCDILF